MRRMDPFKSVNVHVWAGGKIEWTPTIRYVGGLRHEFSGVELAAICVFDFFSWYTTTTGEQVFSPDVFYLISNEGLDTGLRKVNNDEDIRQMRENMKNKTSLNIWIEENAHPQVDESGEHQVIVLSSCIRLS